jgi:hypothetical protein
VATVPDPASEMSFRAADDARRLILAHVDATDVGVDAVFLSNLDTVVRRCFADVEPDALPDRSDEYLASLLAALAYLVRSLALQAAPLDPDANLRRLIADCGARGTTF